MPADERLPPLPLPVSTPTAIEERWRALVLALRAEFWNGGQDPNETLFSLFEMRLLRGRLTDPPETEEWYSVPVLDRELETADAREIAHDFYLRYRAARARRVG